MVSFIKSRANATRIGWHLWEIDLRFAPGLPTGWILSSRSQPRHIKTAPRCTFLYKFLWWILNEFDRLA